MIYTDLTKKALKLCFEAHKNQFDKSGIPYVTHLLHLAEQMPDEITTVVALLHDVVEDSDFTMDDIIAAGFPREVTDPLALLTHDMSVPYFEYVADLKHDPVARRVKLADLRHNSDISRIDHPTAKDVARVQKYHKAIALLEDENDESESGRGRKKIDPFERFDKDWALVTAGTPEHFNSMTISWGSMGTIWGKSIITVYVRPDRYTWNFLKEKETFTVSFYPEECRPALVKMGRLSGRDTDKTAASGLTPRILGENVTYAEASETFICKKIYMAQMKYEDVPDVAKQIYQNGIEPHYIIMGEVIRQEG